MPTGKRRPVSSATRSARGAGVFDTQAALATAVANTWPGHYTRPFAVRTGGESLLQLDPPLVGALRAAGVELAIETNSTLPVPDGIDWVCVSPKAGARLVATRGDEVKLV